MTDDEREAQIREYCEKFDRLNNEAIATGRSGFWTGDTTTTLDGIFLLRLLDEARAEISRLRAPPDADARERAESLEPQLVGGSIEGIKYVDTRWDYVCDVIARAIEQAALAATRDAHRATAPAFESMGIALRMIRDAVEEIGPVGCVPSRDIGPPDPPRDAEDIIQAIARAAPRRDLFIDGEFPSHSGLTLPFKIDCDALAENDIRTLARVIAKRVAPFGSVVGVPRAGLRLAEALRSHITAGPILIVDDVLTTGASMAQARQTVREASGADAIGAVIFARGPCPPWIYAVFSDTLAAREEEREFLLGSLLRPDMDDMMAMSRAWESAGGEWSTRASVYMCAALATLARALGQRKPG